MKEIIISLSLVLMIFPVFALNTPKRPQGSCLLAHFKPIEKFNNYKLSKISLNKNQPGKYRLDIQYPQIKSSSFDSKLNGFNQEVTQVIKKEKQRYIAQLKA